MRLIVRIKGGPGSGNHGHKGRQGVVGGSSIRGTVYIVEGAKSKVLAYAKSTYTQEQLDRGMQELHSMVDNSPVAMMVPSNILLEHILSSGEFLNQHSTGSSKGVLNSGLRKDAEKKVFGEDKEDPGDLPIYGFIPSAIGKNPRPKDAPKTYIESPIVDEYDYGDVKVVFNPEVRDRTTITVGDSLLAIKNGTTCPSPLNYLGEECIANGLGKRGLYGEYIEAQIHGRLTLKDVDYIDISHVDRNLRDKVIESLESLGIKYIA